MESLIGDYLWWRGWKVRKTDVIRGGRGKQVGEPGQADSICLRPNSSTPLLAEVFFAEFKRPMARTKKARLKTQTAWANDMRDCGFLVYQCPEGCVDPYEHFREWYRLHISEQET